MVLNVISTILQAAIAKSNIGDEQMLNQRFGVSKKQFKFRIEYLLVKIAGELNFSFKNLLVNVHWVSIIEWVNTSDHLVSQYSECPPVHCVRVTPVENKFGREIRGSAAH